MRTHMYVGSNFISAYLPYVVHSECMYKAKKATHYAISMSQRNEVSHRNTHRNKEEPQGLRGHSFLLKGVSLRPPQVTVTPAYNLFARHIHDKMGCALRQLLLQCTQSSVQLFFSCFFSCFFSHRENVNCTVKMRFCINWPMLVQYTQSGVQYTYMYIKIYI